MTALTNKQRVKVNATLAIIHSSGGDASAITAKANALRRQGHPARTAFETALNEALAATPDTARSVVQVVRLIEASDDSTVAQYDHALSFYNQTGSETELQALAPMMARDAAALAIRNGEMTAADIADGGLADALGFEPDDAMIAAAMAAPPVTATVAPSEQSAPHSFAFQSPATAQPTAPAKSSSRYDGPFAARGFSVPKTGVDLARQTGLPMAYVNAQAGNAAAPVTTPS